MFDAATGVLTFEQPPVTIAPRLTRDLFANSSMVARATTASDPNGKYHKWRLRQCRSAGVAFFVEITFEEQRLMMLMMADENPRFGTSWADHSLEKEMARKASHDAWLTRTLGPQREFPWGKVWSGYEDRSGGSSIVVYPEAG
ncbi:MAG TPA: hypothetical protein VGR35_07045 [Tepidisphaeraceae bacterium]|nr:hypothetical protein [Tepidisphaeraceae bacterium]